MNAKDFNMYKDWNSDNVILEVLGFDGEVLEKIMFASYESARYHILKNTDKANGNTQYRHNPY